MLNNLRILPVHASVVPCMMMAAVADGGYSSAEEAVSRAVHIRKEYLPDEEQHERYMRKYLKYKKFYGLMHDFK